MAIDRQKQVDTVYEGHGILGWGIPYIYYQDTMPTAAQLGPWWQYRPAEAKKLLAEAGHPNGFETTLFYYEYFPQMTSQVQLVQQDLKKNLNINLKITKLDYTSYYGRYVDGKWDGMAWGFQSGHAVGVDERPYHNVSNRLRILRVNDSVIDELPQLRPDPHRAEQRGSRRRSRRELAGVAMWIRRHRSWSPALVRNARPSLRAPTARIGGIARLGSIVSSMLIGPLIRWRRGRTQVHSVRLRAAIGADSHWPFSSIDRGFSERS